MKTLRIIEELSRDNKLSRSDRGAARFFLKHSDDILYIIKSGDAEKISKHQQLMNESTQFQHL